MENITRVDMEKENTVRKENTARKENIHWNRRVSRSPKKGKYNKR